MVYIGLDIGSTAAKSLVYDGEQIVEAFVLPTGWSSKETAGRIKERLEASGYDVGSEDTKIIATGYGRISVEYADVVFTEITCHGKGGAALTEQNGVIIDVGGQDTKIITIENGSVARFTMNDKCSAGTGKFIEIMANRMGLAIPELFALAQEGSPMPISSMCTVFAESEVISLIGAGEARENIAAGVVESVASKVALLACRHELHKKYLLTGGLSTSSYFAARLSAKLGHKVHTHDMGQYAGAYGAALLAAQKYRPSAGR